MNTQFQNKIYDTIVIGAGISGISAACHLKKYSPKANFLILEGRDNFGGTWDFFKYPGIRSDSDMHTLGFSFKPWNSRKFIADGPAIMGYLDETIEENNLKDLIKFNMHIESASWNSVDSLWELRINNKKLNKLEIIKTKFIQMCAGYYSYKWAEVLSADAFSAFEDVGLDNDDAVKETGLRFKNTVLGLGGSQDPNKIFAAFRGRGPTTDALLRHNGLV